MGAVQAAAAALVLAATGTPQTVVTQAWSGRTLTLPAGKGAVLRLSERWAWSKPEVTGDAIRLTRVYYDRDPGYREWSIRTQHTGRAVIRSVGRPGAKLFVLHVHVK